MNIPSRVAVILGVLFTTSIVIFTIKPVYTPGAKQLLEDAGHWSRMKFSQKPSEFQKAMTREIKSGKVIWGVGHGHGIHYDLVLSFAKEWHQLPESEKQKFLKLEKS